MNGVCVVHVDRHEFTPDCVQWDGSEETRLREEVLLAGRLLSGVEIARQQAEARAAAAESALAELCCKTIRDDKPGSPVCGGRPIFGFCRECADEHDAVRAQNAAEAASLRSALAEARGALCEIVTHTDPDRMRVIAYAALARAGEQETPLAEMRAAKDAAYAERNQCVALIVRMALALGWRAGVRDHEDKPGEAWESDWRNLVCIDLPAGQVSWHFHDSEKHLLAGLPNYPASWDGHDTPEKYRRVNATLAAPAGEPASSGQEVEFNLNHSVLVKVTEVGRGIYAEHWRALGLEPPALPVDAEGWSRFQLWDLMSVFGSGLYNGCRVPVETTIRLCREAALRQPPAPPPGEQGKGGGEGRVATLFAAIAHGDEAHRAWLKQAIADHFAGKPVRPPEPAKPAQPPTVCLVCCGIIGRCGHTSLTPPTEDDCCSCGEVPNNDCPKSLRPCGHHCNHSWSHDACCWCGFLAPAQPAEHPASGGEEKP